MLKNRKLTQFDESGKVKVKITHEIRHLTAFGTSLSYLTHDGWTMTCCFRLIARGFYMRRRRATDRRHIIEGSK